MAAKPYDQRTSMRHLLRRTQQLAATFYANEIKSVGLTSGQFAVLYTVDAREGLSQTDLVKETGIDRSTLAEMIRRMTDDDLLSRRRTDGDGRANAVKITAAGRKALKAAIPAVTRAETRMMEFIPASRRNEFFKTLTLLADAADALEADGAMEEPKKRTAKKRR